MQMLSDDDLNLKDMTDEELAQAWDLWFDLAQTTNDDDPHRGMHDDAVTSLGSFQQ